MKIVNTKNETYINEWNETTDVLVIGTGFAGLSAAIEAKMNGANVIILEKMNAPGGNSIISDGGIAAAGTDIQKRKGIEDSAEQMYKDMVEAGRGLNNPELLALVVNQSNEVFEWSQNEIGVNYLDRVDIFGGHSVPRCYTPEGVTGATIIKQLMKKIQELNVKVRFKTQFKSFVVDEEGQVVGACILKDYNYKQPSEGTVEYIRANKGVVLATGGYGADVEFRKIQDPRLTKDIDTTNKPFATAEGLKAALRIGGASVQLSQIQLGAWASPDEKGMGKGPLFADYILFQYGVIIDPKTGKRFVNELGDRKVSADAILGTGHPCIGIADEEAVIGSGWNIDQAINRQVVKKYDSFTELAEYYGINEEILVSEIDKYNQFVENKKDLDFGKIIVDRAKPINKPPYYVMRLWPKVHFTMGGIKINKNAQVEDFSGNVIENLYAAGEVTGGVHGASRLGSCAVTECFVFGRIAGKKVAEN